MATRLISSCSPRKSLADPEPATAVFQTRTGLAALELDASGPPSSALLDAVAEAARLDAYAAREVLDHPPARSSLSAEQASALGSVVEAAGLGAGTLPTHHQRALSESVALGEAELRRLLQDHQAAPGNPLEAVPHPT